MEKSLTPKAPTESLLIREVDDELLILDQENEKIHQLNKSAAIIWMLCDGKNNIEAIISQFSKIFDLSLTQAEKDVIKVISELINIDLIAIEPSIREKG